MKHLLLHTLLVSFLAMPLFGGVTADQVQGHWKISLKESDFTRSSVASYLPGGVYSEAGTITVTFDGDEQNFPFKVQGMWKLDDGTLVTTVKKSTAPDFLEVGSIRKYKIQKATETSFTFEAGSKKKPYVATRTAKP